MSDIQNSDDLYLLVAEFYKKLFSDDSIAYIFTEVVKIHLHEHLPILVTFWSQSLLNTGSYFKNAMQSHFDINQKNICQPSCLVFG